MTITQSTDRTFKKDLKSKGFTLVNFWASWCGPCRSFAPVLETFDRTHSDIKVLKVNVEEHPLTTAEHKVMSLPATILFKNGKPVDKFVGMVSIEKLKQFISSHNK